VETDGDRRTLRIFPTDPEMPIADRVIASLGQKGIGIASVFVEQGRLDDVFRTITTGK
jgi:ABC-2 type transport system ATP-binding protein